MGRRCTELAGITAASYEAELVDRGLLDDAKNAAAAKGVHGGASEAESLEHFAARFVTSSGRVGYSVLGPDSGFDEVSDAFLSTFLGWRSNLVGYSMRFGPFVSNVIGNISLVEA